MFGADQEEESMERDAEDMDRNEEELQEEKLRQQEELVQESAGLAADEEVAEYMREENARRKEREENPGGDSR
jgi:hypothetical protein